MIGECNVGELECKFFVECVVWVILLVVNQFNFGLCLYYFGLVMFVWFINFWFFMLVMVGVVLVLYCCEFYLDVLEVMVYIEIVIVESLWEGEGEVFRG